ncbi:MAG TPA: NAD(P)/FAD-dependent oxidoreductase [Methanospirillum sp.]|uniref:NAD(P)/FAD-dependent oxidoreductase n=1 Tax=Methanospirillum sp. TaxID=45200 RepID=UPI002CEF1A63|nr:NAD(P)/FAD-dependent oxidoreductase [Methanospirillum sp.]HWQ64154.1 NAD(P)/FAD-dependent oxidoreductase [Methanospirillum sp.]
MSGDISLIIVGGGPAGLFCALQAASENIDVLVLEKKRSCGNKLLISGSGQCNITHDGEIRQFLLRYGDNGSFLKSSLMNFGNQDLIKFFNERGVPLEIEPGGKVFPVSRKASDILDLLIHECQRSRVKIKNSNPVTDVAYINGRFQVTTSEDMNTSNYLVIATGGETYPATGSTGDGFKFASRFGHTVSDTGSALTGIQVKDYRFSDLSGISFADLTITLFRDGKKIKTHTGDILFTHSGLSGPGILDFSRYIRPGDTLKISLTPGIDTREMNEVLIKRISESGSKQLRTVLGGFDLPERVVRRLLELANVDPDLTGPHLTKKDRIVIVDLITACPFEVSKLGGPEEAMATWGGVSLSEINPKTMESRIVSGLFFVGEVLDIDGDTGGYNLQAAFSTAKLAAQRLRVLSEDVKN